MPRTSLARTDVPDLIAFVESVPLPVYALMAAVGILLIAASFVRGDGT